MAVLVAGLEASAETVGIGTCCARATITTMNVPIATSPEDLMSVLRAPGQTSFAFVFDIARTVDEMKQRDRDW